MNQTANKNINRRWFLQTAAVATAAASASAAAGRQARATPSPTLRTDVLVCGGGCAGSAAALAAARAGANVLLVEKAPFAGGIVTCVGLPYFDGIAHITTKRVVVRGIALELLSKSGVCPPDAKTVAKHNPTIPNTFEFKLLLDRLFRKQQGKLTVLFNSFACDAHAAGGRVETVSVANKDGLVTVRPGVVIDCTGDADVAARARAPYSKTRSCSRSRCTFASATCGRSGGSPAPAEPPWRRRTSGASCLITTAPA